MPRQLSLQQLPYELQEEGRSLEMSNSSCFIVSSRSDRKNLYLRVLLTALPTVNWQR